MDYTCNLPEINIIVSIGNTRVKPSLYKRVIIIMRIQATFHIIMMDAVVTLRTGGMGSNFSEAPTKFLH